MKLRAVMLAIGLSAMLGGCEDVTLFGDDDSSGGPSAMANGCTPQGCPQAAQFCVARGYQPDTERYRRCLASVEDNLRKGTR